MSDITDRITEQRPTCLQINASGSSFPDGPLERIVGPCGNGVTIVGGGSNSGIRGPDVTQQRIGVVTELGDGPLSDVGFKHSFVLNGFDIIPSHRRSCYRLWRRC